MVKTLYQQKSKKVPLKKVLIKKYSKESNKQKQKYIKLARLARVSEHASALSSISLKTIESVVGEFFQDIQPSPKLTAKIATHPKMRSSVATQFMLQHLIKNRKNDHIAILKENGVMQEALDEKHWSIGQANLVTSILEYNIGVENLNYFNIKKLLEAFNEVDSDDGDSDGRSYYTRALENIQKVFDRITQIDETQYLRIKNMVNKLIDESWSASTFKEVATMLEGTALKNFLKLLNHKSRLRLGICMISEGKQIEQDVLQEILSNIKTTTNYDRLDDASTLLSFIYDLYVSKVVRFDNLDIYKVAIKVYNYLISDNFFYSNGCYKIIVSLNKMMLGGDDICELSKRRSTPGFSRYYSSRQFGTACNYSNAF